MPSYDDDDEEQPDEEKEEEEEEHEEEIVDPEKLENGGKTIFVGGWSVVKTIAEAMAKCEDNDGIYCNPGQYNEKVVFEKSGLHLTGPDNLTCILGKGICSYSLFCNVSNVCIREGVEVKCGNITIEACDISNARFGVQIHQTANPNIKKCSIHSIQKSHIIVYPGGNGLIENNQLVGDKSRGTVGLYMDNSDATIFTGNHIQGTMTGIFALHGCKSTQVLSNTISEVEGHGIYLDQQAKPVFKENEVLLSGHYGIVISGGSAGNFTNNIIHGPIRIHRACHPSFFNNIIVLPSKVINDDAVYAVRGIVSKKVEDLPKKKKEKPPEEDDEGEAA